MSIVRAWVCRRTCQHEFSVPIEGLDLPDELVVTGATTGSSDSLACSWCQGSVPTNLVESLVVDQLTHNADECARVGRVSVCLT